MDQQSDHDPSHGAIKPLPRGLSCRETWAKMIKAASSEKIRKAKMKAAETGNVSEFRVEIYDAALKAIDAGALVLEDKLNIAETDIESLIDTYNIYERPSLIIRQTIGEKVNEMERQARDLRSQLVIRRWDKSTIAGKVADTILMGHDDEAEALILRGNWAYIDVLVSNFRTPTHDLFDRFQPSDSDPTERCRFEAVVFNAYRCKMKLRCCITGTTLDPVAAKVIPDDIREGNAVYLFGKSTHGIGHLMCPQNGLPMLKDLAKAFENGWFVIVPGEKSDEWKVVFLGDFRSSRLILVERVFGPLNGRVLKFHTYYRPDKRYLYLAYIVAIVRRQRYERKGWWKSIPPFHLEVGKTPRQYLRKSALVVLAERLGHMSPTEARELIGVSDKDEEGSNSLGRAVLFSDFIGLSSRWTMTSEGLDRRGPRYIDPVQVETQRRI